MSDHVELFSATGYEAFVLKKTGEFASGISIFVELGIVIWAKTPNFQNMILQNDYCYEASINQTFEHFYIHKHKDSVIFMINEVEINDFYSNYSNTDMFSWESISLSLQNKILNKRVIISAKKTSEILIIGRSEVFVEIGFLSTKFETTHRMVCNLNSFTNFLKNVSEVVFS
jgi:hypothetical protein